MNAPRQAKSSSAVPIAISVNPAQNVSALLQNTPGARACYVVAHGAGAGMQHPFLANVANGLAERKIATLRYQFPYMERGSPRPDTPAVAQETVRAATRTAASLLLDLPVFAGGKSFGGRMSSQAQAQSPLPAVRGLIFLGFPLHPPGQASDKRAEHLYNITVPMLFLQGDHDEFANLDLLQSVIQKLGARATLKLFPDANHSFHVPARTGRKDPEVMAQVLSTMSDWMEQVISGHPV